MHDMLLNWRKIASGAALVSSSVYLNATDGNFHLKGLLKNTLAEARDFISITASFIDLKTNMTIGEKISTVGGIFGTSHAIPGATVPFDMDTGYKASEINQLALIRVMLTV
jgi:hypothetical protein